MREHAGRTSSDTSEINDLHDGDGWHCDCNHAARIGHPEELNMCGSVQAQRQQPVYTPPAPCAPQAQPQAPKTCAPPPCDTFTPPPPPPVVSPEKAPPVVASPERPTSQSTPNADSPASCAKNENACAPERGAQRKGLMKMLGALFTAVFAFAAVFMNRRPDVANADARPERNRADRDACARDWRNFERPRQSVVAPERDSVRPQAFTPPTYTQRV